MNIDDLLHSLRTARCEEADRLLAHLATVDAELSAVPRGRQHATTYGRIEARRNSLRRDAAKIVAARGWNRQMPSDDYDGSYIGHEDR